MPARLRKLIGLFAILGFLFVYLVIVARVGMDLPDVWWIKLAYYGVVGTFWGVPLFPLIRWMNRER